jgi:hypothetical protein
MLDRVQPHQFNIVVFSAAMPRTIEQEGFLAQFKKEVPDEMVALDRDDEGGLLAEVACICGATPRVPEGRIVGCEGCARVFSYTGSRVIVAWRDGEGRATDLGRADSYIRGDMSDAGR